MNFHPYGMWGSEHNHHILGLKYNKLLNAAFVGDIVTLTRYIFYELTSLFHCLHLLNYKNI